MASDKGVKYLTPEILRMLEKETGLGNARAWSNIMSVVSKGEHDSLNWWLDSDKKNIYGFAAMLPWDWSKNTEGGGRGVTIGIVGFTTHHEAKPEGDAQLLFKEYARLGGKNLAPMSVDCAHDKDAGKRLIKEIKKIADDPTWMHAQWNCLMADSGSGYVSETMRICKKRGITKPSALTIAALFDCSMNHGATGSYGSRKLADKVPDHIRGEAQEKAFLKAFLEIRLPEAGKHGLASPPINGTNRVNQFLELLNKGCTDLLDDAAIRNATDWEMK
jgi:hypothetical protein